ncbi:hypothetical protein [Parasynechococcus sp.]|uniref:hypothetical protein n=1 Tax=Parasynechococcus sp. TaxID=3101203 RepID=UPI003704BD34
MPSPRRILLLLASIVGAALVGWISAAYMAQETRARARRQAEDLQVELPRQQLQAQDELNEAERGLLLEHLVALERLQEAEVVLQPWLSGCSTPRELTRFKGLEPGQRLEIGLLLADLLRQSGSDQAAIKLCGQLAAEDMKTQSPLLALALLKQERDDT